MKTLLRKIKAETPKIWRDIQKLSLSLSAVATTVLTYNQSSHILSESDIIVLKWVIGIGLALTAYGQTKEKKQ